ncbi:MULTISPECIES: alkaline phosphatase D family protein [unclassified Thalassospira]|uniref:alkaline phosphatase D family protein n=1 Tax=unclassified Thalassospira TaxID=2648997 RepID=UPI0018CC88B2|nr:MULTISPECIES: alkaline phosphatase D family protein [unclassified Thalassospira]QPO11812.1 alkaline phosphatase family protein [Thalassospira sp. A40-3]|tara:strand:- start:608 stop:2065 length:1458 start_codon:yes stop_codon:yes gene_type:complete
MTSSEATKITDQDLYGPFLFARGANAKTAKIAALVVADDGAEIPEFRANDRDVIAPSKLASLFGRSYWRFDFELPSNRSASYSFGNKTYEVCTDLGGDLRIGFVSCNGQEDGDLDRPLEDRNALWTDLGKEHAKQPFSLLLHGGDQIYADGVWECDEDIIAWDKAGRSERLATAFSDVMRDAVLKFYLDHYLAIYGQPQIRHMLARVPSLMMWDDHDIFDGWGSHKKWFQGSAVAKGMFDCARQAFCLMQLCCTPDDLPDMVRDREGISLGWRTDFPEVSIVAPDLRSERTPNDVMGAHGWRDLPEMLKTVPDGNRILLMSSVPVIGPRLSLIEMVLHLSPRAQKYEDDLRDQWQSRWHRREWCRFLELIEEIANEHDHEITLLSGEIHVATRGTFETKGKTIHQLVASGISHTAPPPTFARVLGLLAWIGENPLPGRPTELKPLPERKGTYCAARNYLTLLRKDTNWHAKWHLEGIGWTPDLRV